MPLFSRHSLPHQTAYSELKRRSMEQAHSLVGTPGSVGEREVKGRRFYYRQFYDAAGAKAAAYIGPAGQPKGELQAAAIREEIATANALLREARELARVGYARPDSRTGAVLAAAANRALFRAGATVVGSHAYGALLNELGVKAAAYSTQDLDIARGRPLDFEPSAIVRFADVLAESTVPLRPVPSLDRRAPPTSYKVSGADGFRVDLLVPARGSQVTTASVPELAAHATALPFLAYLLDDPIDAIVLGRDVVVPIKVPRPEVFAWHKTLVSQLRRETRDKQHKDVNQAAVLFAILAEDTPDAIELAFAALPRGTREKTRRGARVVVRELEAAGHARAVETLRAFL